MNRKRALSVLKHAIKYLETQQHNSFACGLSGTDWAILILSVRRNRMLR